MQAKCKGVPSDCGISTCIGGLLIGNIMLNIYMLYLYLRFPAPRLQFQQAAKIKNNNQIVGIVSFLTQDEHPTLLPKTPPELETLACSWTG